jgi:hypothetical protein
MKRWLAIAALLGLGIIGWTVPRETPPSGCWEALVFPDSVVAKAFSCEDATDTLVLRGTWPHRRCLAARVVMSVDAGWMAADRALCETAAPAGVDERRVALSLSSGGK